LLAAVTSATLPFSPRSMSGLPLGATAESQ
jgi:hypothetical protein